MRTCASVPHIMLLSSAGPNICSTKALPSDVDFEVEEEWTTAKLETAGLWNDDVREAKLAWNEETRRMMQLIPTGHTCGAKGRCQQRRLRCRLALRCRQGETWIPDTIWWKRPNNEASTSSGIRAGRVQMHRMIAQEY